MQTDKPGNTSELHEDGALASTEQEVATKERSWPKLKRKNRQRIHQLVVGHLFHNYSSIERFSVSDDNDSKIEFYLQYTILREDLVEYPQLEKFVGMTVVIKIKEVQLGRVKPGELTEYVNPSFIMKV